jgi:hypothetical protein
MESGSAALPDDISSPGCEFARHRLIGNQRPGEPAGATTRIFNALPGRLLKNYLRGDRSVKNRLNPVIFCPLPVLALRSLPRTRFSAAC